MTKDVMIAFRSRQYDAGTLQEDRTETVMQGCYYEKNGRQYLIYDEEMEGFAKPIRTKVKFGDGSLEITRSGPVSVRMVFEEDKKNMTSYNTPYGAVLLGINTKKIHISQQPDRIEVNVDYTLEADYGYLSDCSISMEIKAI